MSDPKPLRFAHIDQEVRIPSWLPADKAGANGPAPMSPPRVAVGSIDGAEYRPGLENVPPGVSRGEVANANAGQAEAEQTVPLAEYEALRQQLEAAQAQVQGQEAEIQRLTDEVAAVRNEFVRGAVDLATARSETLAAIETQLLELAVQIASTILDGELEARPELHEQLVQAGLEHLRGESRITLRCSPSAYDAVVESFGGSHFEVKGAQVEVVVDGDLRGAGCVLEAPTRRVDARLSERLAAIRDALLAENRRRREVGA